MNLDLMKSRGSKPRTGKVKDCSYCGKSFYKQPAHSDRAFCSRDCYHMSVNLPFIAENNEELRFLPNFNLFVTNIGNVLAYSQAGFLYKKSPFTEEKRYQTIKSPRNLYVHRLVATGFLGLPEKGMEVNHKDGNKTNNNVVNLEWLTRTENVRHAFANDLVTIRRGEDSHSAKLTQNEVDRIRQLKGEKTYRVIAKMFGVKYSTIAHIMRGSRW